jgi:hypothetical protein
MKGNLVTEDEAIVRELAERGPYIAERDELGDYCVMCGKVDGRESSLADPASHEPSCLWRRACAPHPRAGSFTGAR